MNKFEIVNEDICLKLNKLTFSNFKVELFNGVNFDCVNKSGDDEDIQKQYTLLKQFTTDMIKNKYCLKKTYKFAKNSDYGRLFVQHGGIQRLHHKIRGILCDTLYTDYDMINCHPSILLYLCKENHFPCFNLEFYVNNRDSCINNLMSAINGDRNECKRLFLRSMNSERTIKKYKQNGKMINIKDTFFISLDAEFKTIQNLFLNKYTELKTKLIKLGENDNLQGKVLNRVLCQYENIILNEGINYIKDKQAINNVDKMVLMFDGFMLQNNKDNKKVDDIIELLNVNKYGIKWSKKEHDISILSNLEGINTENNENVLSGYFDTIHDIAIYLDETLFKDKLISCNGILYYADNNILRSDEKQIKLIISNIISKQDLWYKCVFGYLPLISNISNVNDTYKWIRMKVEEDNNFLNNVWDQTLHKICFKNGYYDFREGQFFKDYNNLYTPILIDRDFKPETNIKIREDIFKRVLYPIFSIDTNQENFKESDRFKLMEYMLHKFARVISGHIEDKNWFKFEGLRDSGKGVFSDLLKNAFGKYIQSTNASNFINKRGDEDAKSLSWIIDYQFSRLAVTQEIQLDEGKFIDGNKIKKFCSGGDYFSARKNFQDEIEFKIQSALLICCNDMPEIKPTDAIEKCISFKMTSKFVKDIEKESKYSNFQYYKADGTLKSDFINKDEVVNEFVLLLIDYYKRDNTAYPQSILNNIIELDDEDDEEKLLSLFDINQDTKNIKLTNKELKRIVKDNSISMTMKKAKELLIGKGCSSYRTDKSRGIKGASEIINFVDDDDEDEE